MVRLNRNSLNQNSKLWGRHWMSPQRQGLVTEKIYVQPINRFIRGTPPASED
jgi:hypothetical protein